MRKIVTCILLVSFIWAMNPVPAGAFTDTRGHWAKETIDHLAARGVVAGKSNLIFAPETPVTRAEFATLLVQCLGWDDEAKVLQKGSSTFRDVAPTFWAKGSLELCYEMGIMVPDQEGLNYPLRSISRAEAAVMAVKALGADGTQNRVYLDQTSIPSWAVDSIPAAGEAGIMKGYPDDTFRPGGQVTRAEAVVITANIMQYYGELYHGTGELVSLDRTKRRGTVKVNGKSYTFELAANFIMDTLDARKNLQLPVICLFDLNDSGDLVYCREIETDILPEGMITTIESALPEKTIGDSLGLWGGDSAAGNDTNEPPADRARLETWAEAAASTTVDVRLSGTLNKTEVKADVLRSLLDVDGTGVKVAVIDSGIDAGHPDLQTTPDGHPKIADWIDLTDQGRVELLPVGVNQGHIVAAEREISLGNNVSQSGTACYGFLRPSQLPVEITIAEGEQLLVTALDTEQAGVYDKVLVDTNGDGRLEDEQALSVYSKAQEWDSLLTFYERRPLNFVVSDLSSSGDYLKLGYDAVGHGTRVAGVLAGQGLMQGIAPGAQIVAIKVYDGFGRSDIARLEQAIRLAGNLGVQVVNLSMGFTGLADRERQEIDQLIKEISSSRGITFCIAAGNLGPGLTSISTPAGSPAGIAVGGYLSPAMWSLNYGWQIEQPTTWYFSSVGPYEGGVSPLIVAPASAVTIDAQWHGGYVLDEGTSMATPYAAGGVALLVEAARNAGIKVSPEAIRTAVMRGGTRLGDFSMLEVGYGGLDLVRTWEALQELAAPALDHFQGEGQGFYARSTYAGTSYLSIMNDTGANRYLNLSTTSPWISLRQETIQIPADGDRSIPVDYTTPAAPGIYSGMVLGKDPTRDQTTLEVLQTIIVPYNLTRNTVAKVEDELAAGLYRRYFFKVPQGSGSLNLRINIPKTDGGQYQGRVRVHLMEPGGNVVLNSGYAGSGYPQTSGQESIPVKWESPTAGVWELVVYSSVGLGQYGLQSSRFGIDASLGDWVEAEVQPSDDKYIITAVPQGITAGVSNWATLNFWDRISKLPAQGKVIINNMIYDLKNGQVQIKVISQDQFPWFQVEW